ncbi:hypothetical protein CTAYLR_009581 [Chrysophaeum taylorii]|uniref:Uncharacterized protein n=1 Tax=Chrysophaeum taylorii TaxID=2483200 RepID=A0AAD7UPM2_9STRA|nr:hypothetical protein CTAYLR_009581 [Chrysophaeum taylorii]
MRSVGVEVRNWSARTMDGEVLYHLRDVVESGEAPTPALVARRDVFCANARSTTTSTARASRRSWKIRWMRPRRELSAGEWIAADLLIAADGRYSTVSDFRLVATGEPPMKEPLWRVYNNNNNNNRLAEGWVRVGLVRLGDGTVGMLGNVRTEDVENNSKPDAIGEFVMDLLRTHGDAAHWSRERETDACYEALGGKSPGANLCLEDAAVFGALYHNNSLHRYAALRTPRRNFIREMSRKRARRSCFPSEFDAEMSNWRSPSWRRRYLQRLWNASGLVLRAKRATEHNFKPFGELATKVPHGAGAGPELDLARGTPRLYLTKLEGPRPLEINRITRHIRVTQCLGAVGDEDFYSVVRAPADRPALDDLVAFRIPPRHFVKLHKGTWHAGPLWKGDAAFRTFFNLEHHADTNVVDHDSRDRLPPPRRRRRRRRRRRDGPPLPL